MEFIVETMISAHMENEKKYGLRCFFVSITTSLEVHESQKVVLVVLLYPGLLSRRNKKKKILGLYESSHKFIA